MCLGVLALKSAAGGAAFLWLGHQVELFLNHVTAGVSFVFGDKYQDFLFAFKVWTINNIVKLGTVFLASAKSPSR